MNIIPMKVIDISLSNLGFIVFLQEENHEYCERDSKVLPIFVGLAEAQSIAVEVNKMKIVRPLTHDLIINLLNLLDCEVYQVLIDGLVDSTFMAKILLKTRSKKIQLDIRPSDAIALALRLDSPIYVSEEVMSQGLMTLKDEDKFLEQGKKTELDILQSRLDDALEEEHYEEAARIRDEIKKLSSFGHMK